MVDKGYFWTMFHGGTVLLVSGLLWSSICQHLGSLWLLDGRIAELGMGMCFCPGIVALMTWFDETKIGSAVALTASGNCLGRMVYVLLARYLPKNRIFSRVCLLLSLLLAGRVANTRWCAMRV